MADEQPPAEQQPQEQQFYRQYLQSTAPDGTTTIREIVSPNLLDHDAATAAEQRAGYTFTGFVDPEKMRGVPPAQATPAPPPEDAAPVLPSGIVPTSGAVPSGYTPPQPAAAPGSSPWLNMIPPAMATVGPLALAVAQPELGIPLWLASGGLAALGGGGGEAIREKLAGEELSPRNIATQGAVSGLTDVGMSTVVNPYVLGPVARTVTGRLGKVAQAAEDLGPLVTSEGTTVAAPAALAPEVAAPLRVTGLKPIDLAGRSAEQIQALAAQATPAERPAIAAAWVASARQGAQQSGDPVTYMRGAYAALGEETQRALFGAQKGAFERVLQSAWGGTPEEISALVQASGAETVGTGAVGAGLHYAGLPLHVPTTLAGVRTLADFSAPFAARGMLMSPTAARFGGALSSFGNVAGPGVSNLAAQSVAERARQAGLPTF